MHKYGKLLQQFEKFALAAVHLLYSLHKCKNATIFSEMRKNKSTSQNCSFMNVSMGHFITVESDRNPFHYNLLNCSLKVWCGPQILHGSQNSDHSLNFDNMGQPQLQHN